MIKSTCVTTHELCRYAQLQEHPVEITAQGIANSAKILCLDELHVSDVADALILSQVPCSATC